MKRVRRGFTYANVMSSLAVFLILGGATALAAGKIGSHRLKTNSVTTAKIKQGAITTAKIKGGAVTGNKIGLATITASNINLESTPFSRVIAKPRGGSNQSLTEKFQIYPLNQATYTQRAEEDNTYMGAVDITFDPSCTGARSAQARVVVDSPSPANAEENEIVAVGTVKDENPGTVTTRMQLAPSVGRFEPGSATPHTVAIVVKGSCEGGSGIQATAGAVDVIGTK